MNKVQRGRFSASLDGDVVVFLIGMRFNQWWRIWQWLPVLVAMPRMIIELRRHPDLGLLSPPRTYLSGRVVCVVQYWESFAKLESYARASDHEHLPAWRRFNKRVRDNGAVGIWHETYQIAATQTEAIYVNMPLFGLAQATSHVPTSTRGQSAARRLGVRESDDTPLAPY